MVIAGSAEAALALLVEERIRGFAEAHGARPLYVDWSGGKDSTLVLLAADRVMEGAVVAWFIHIPGQTHSDNLRAARRVAEALGYEWVTLKPKTPGEARRLYRDLLGRRHTHTEGRLVVHVMSRAASDLPDFWAAIERYGLPVNAAGRVKRWCCDLYKTNYLEVRPGNCEDGAAVCNATGVRWEESVWRRGRGVEVRVREGYVLNPIIDLTTGQVWRLLKTYSEEAYRAVKAQYDAGWPRAPNCAFCVVLRKPSLEAAARNLPTPYLRRALRALTAVEERVRGAETLRRLQQMREVIVRELERRGEQP